MLKAKLQNAVLPNILKYYLACKCTQQFMNILCLLNNILMTFN